MPLSKESKSIIRQFRLKYWYEMVDIKTKDYLVQRADYKEVRKALIEAGIAYSISSGDGIYAHRLTIHEVYHD